MDQLVKLAVKSDDSINPNLSSRTSLCPRLQELDILRASNSRLEERLTDEKEGRRATEGQAISQLSVKCNSRAEAIC